MGPTNKENMPLELGIMPLELEEALIQKATQVNRFHTTFAKGKWTIEAVEEAMEADEKTTCSLGGLFHQQKSPLLQLSFQLHLEYKHN